MIWKEILSSDWDKWYALLFRKFVSHHLFRNLSCASDWLFQTVPYLWLPGGVHVSETFPTRLPESKSSINVFCGKTSSVYFSLESSLSTTSRFHLGLPVGESPPLLLKARNNFSQAIIWLTVGREMIMLSSISFKSLMSCVLTPEKTTDSGSPFSSVKALRFVPIFPRSVGYVPPTPVSKALLSYNHQLSAIPSRFLLIRRISPNSISIFFKEICCLPFLKIPVNVAAAHIFSRYCFLMAPGSQNIEDSLQHLPGGQAWPSLPRWFLVMLVRISLFFRNILFDSFPEFIWYYPGLCPFFLFHRITSRYYSLLH